MNKDLALCHPGDDVRVALKTMAQRQLRRLPVLDDAGALRGILSLSDIALRTAGDLSNDLFKVSKAIYDRRDRRKAAQQESIWSEQAAA